MTHTRFRPSLRLLIALAVWLAVVLTAFVCARFAERLTVADVHVRVDSRLRYVQNQHLVAWQQASPRTPASLAKALGPGPDESGATPTPQQLDPLWIWELPANRTTVDFGDLGTPVWTRGAAPQPCSLRMQYSADLSLGSRPDGLGEVCSMGADPSANTAVAMSVLPTGHGTALVVAETIDVSQEHFPLDYQRAETRRLAIIIGLVGALAAWLLAGAISRPIQRLGRTVDRFGAGELDTRAAVAGPREVALLATDVNAMADRVQRTMDGQRRFVADTAHELRTPTAALLASSQALDLTAPHDEALDFIVPQVERLAGLTEDLLALNRFDEGGQRLDAQPVDLADLVRQAVAHVAPTGDVHIEGSVPDPVLVDPGRVSAIVRNLVANALQHGAEPVTVTIGERPDGVGITVADAGPGVPRELRSQVFDRFVRGDASRHDDGRGLGLALARENARLHGGDLVLAEDGRTFILTLPVERPEVVVAGSQVASTPTVPTVLGRALPLALCLGVGLLLALLAQSGRLYLANDSDFFHRPTWQWLPLFVLGWAAAALAPAGVEIAVRRIVPGWIGRVLGLVAAAPVLAVCWWLVNRTGEFPVSAAVFAGGLLWLGATVVGWTWEFATRRRGGAGPR